MSEKKQEAFQYIERHRAEMLSLWQELVNIESGSRNKAGVDRIAARLHEIISEDAADVKIVEYEHAGNMLIACYGADRKAAPVAFMGHMDTVFPDGTVDRRPFSIRDGVAYGPGVLDMKGGIVVQLYAVKALQAAGYDCRPLKILLAGDEEIAHQNSNAAELFQIETNGCIAAFNCETGFDDDRIVVGRKGGGTFLMETFGVAAHTGNNPRDGRSAILELAQKVVEVHKLTDWDAGTTFSVGTFQGGTVSNSTPDYARMEIDVRCIKASEVAEITRRLSAIAAHNFVAGTRTVLSGGISFLPMEMTPEGLKLYDLVAKTAIENGLGTPTPIQSGGASDSANSVIAGVPTVCSMGVKGGKNHAPDEYAVVESLFERAKLLAACVLRLDNCQ